MLLRSCAVGFLLLASCGGSVDSGGSPAPSPASRPPPSEGPSEDPSPASANDRCSTPRRIALVDGRLELTDETLSVSDEHPALDCASRGTADTLVGPQRYYVLAVHEGRTYRFALTPSFHAVLYGFDRAVGCDAATIQVACRSKGTTGFASGLVNPGTGKPGATVFAVPPPFVAERDMDLELAVDSDGAAGSFVLTITEE